MVNCPHFETRGADAKKAADKGTKRNPKDPKGGDWKAQVRSVFHDKNKRIRFKSIKPKNSITGAWTFDEECLPAVDELIGNYNPGDEVAARSFRHPLHKVLRGFRSAVDDDFKTAINNFRSYFESLEKMTKGSAKDWWPSGREWVPVGDVPKDQNQRSKDKRTGENSRSKKKAAPVPAPNF